MTIGIALMAGLTTTATAAPVQTAAAAPSTQATSAPSTQAAGISYFLVFDKNPGDQTKSKLTLYRYRGDLDRSFKIDSWRAGSGYTKNTCTRNAGWLPNGTYKIPSWDKRYDGSKIKGYVLQLENKKCHNGTPRTELFIHSEMTRNGGQGSPERWRWDGVSDYKSEGCVKLRPADIKDLFGSTPRKPTKLIVKS